MQNDFNRVIKIDSDLFLTKTPQGRVFCRARKKNKIGEILAGDFVRIDDGVIQDVLPRKNRMIRPAIANVDQILFVICCVPKPDYFLLDKAMINCFARGIEAAICINKSDVNDELFAKNVKDQYSSAEVLSVSALLSEVDDLKKILSGKLTCLAGQSAVGKSSIVNALLSGEKASGLDDGICCGKKDNIKIGELSAINRGKNTTTSVELYEVCGGLLADTPGFSLLDFQDIESAELELYYPEFDELRNECRYHKCTHINEPDCAVRFAAQNGTINGERYKRYLKLFDELRQQELRKY